MWALRGGAGGTLIAGGGTGGEERWFRVARAFPTRSKGRRSGRGVAMAVTSER